MVLPLSSQELSSNAAVSGSMFDQPSTYAQGSRSKGFALCYPVNVTPHVVPSFTWDNGSSKMLLTLVPMCFNVMFCGCAIEPLEVEARECLSMLGHGKWSVRKGPQRDECVMVLCPVFFGHCVTFNVHLRPSVDASVELSRVWILHTRVVRREDMGFVVSPVLVSFDPLEGYGNGEVLDD